MPTKLRSQRSEHREKAAMELRVLDAIDSYDGDACRPEYGIAPDKIARLIIDEHWDLVTCFCPLCVLAREMLS